MKIIFLDIDGVLNSDAFEARCMAEAAWPPQSIDTHSVKVLQKIVDEVGGDNVGIVISSSWRLLYRLSEIRGYLRNYGLTASVIGRTPSLPSRFEYKMESIQTTRGHEIHHWLWRNWNLSNVEQFVILDDCEDMWELKGNFCMIDAREGLVDRDVERVLATLNQREPGLHERILKLGRDPRVQALWSEERDIRPVY